MDKQQATRIAGWVVSIGTAAIALLSGQTAQGVATIVAMFV